jgi:sterol desaturase/sphingolipid hydroxylase (fatty acid hydroxylase superfamily)
MIDSPPKRKIWNYQPADLVPYNPLFSWPPKIGQSFNWMVRRWISVSRFVLFIALGFIIQHYLTPSYEVMKGFSLDWILSVFLRNTALLFLIAGSLHLYLHSYKVQGDKFKFLKREMDTNNKIFKFNNQVYDNVFWSVVSGVTVWTIYEVLYLTLVARGVVATAPLADYPFHFFAWILCFPLIRGVHFYFIHRLLHHPFLYKHVHITHHRNVNTGPWSGISMHPIENVIYQSSPLIHFLVPSDPIIFTIHMIMVTLNPAFTHSGFEKIVKKDTKILDSADFHHQLHHRYFDCNYGNMDVPLDVWFGTDHDGSEAATLRLRDRKRKRS